jgi:hypothetical protein
VVIETGPAGLPAAPNGNGRVNGGAAAQVLRADERIPEPSV